MPEQKDRLKELRIDRADIETTRSGGGFGLAVIAALLVLAAEPRKGWEVEDTFALRQAKETAESMGEGKKGVRE